MKLFNIVINVLIVISILLLVTHLKIVEYFEDDSQREAVEINLSNSKILATLIPLTQDSYILRLSFNQVFCSTFVKNINIDIKEFNNIESHHLEISEIRPYNGLHPEVSSSYPKFSDIPNYYRNLTNEDNHYFVYDFIFKRDNNEGGINYNITIFLEYIEEYNNKTISYELKMYRKKKIELIPMDYHSDFSFLLIPLSTCLTILLVVIRFVLKKAF